MLADCRCTGLATLDNTHSPPGRSLGAWPEGGLLLFHLNRVQAQN